MVQVVSVGGAVGVARACWGHPRAMRVYCWGVVCPTCVVVFEGAHVGGLGARSLCMCVVCVVRGVSVVARVVAGPPALRIHCRLAGGWLACCGPGPAQSGGGGASALLPVRLPCCHDSRRRQWLWPPCRQPHLSRILISEPTRLQSITYAVFWMNKKHATPKST